MRSIFCREAFWKVGCPDRVEPHGNSVARAAEADPRHVTKFSLVPEMDEGAEKRAPPAKHENVKHSISQISQIEHNPTPGFITSNRNPLRQMRVQVLKGQSYANSNPKCQMSAKAPGHWSSYAGISACPLSSCHLSVNRKIQVFEDNRTSSDGKNNKDNDRGHKSCRRHIKLSAHSPFECQLVWEWKHLTPAWLQRS